MTKKPITTVLAIPAPDLLAYSHGLRATYGCHAFSYARQRAIDLARCGDADGEVVWHSLAGLLERQTADRA
jgi:hypothetical protein